MTTPPALLPLRMVEKPWGRENLPIPFASPARQRIGEIWFEPPTDMPDLLVKYIFTSEKLSVQVHPNDEQTRAQGIGAQGKEECWLVIDAEPDARLGIGFHEAIVTTDLRVAALDGQIEDMLVWHRVKAGDFFYIPANTVHAIGAGVTLIEVQQNSDITYRLYDYGRPRELHLDHGLAVARGEIYDLARWHRQLSSGCSAALVDGPYFRMDQVMGPVGKNLTARYADRPVLVLPLVNEVMVAGQTVLPGTCSLARSLSDVQPCGSALYLLAQSCANGH